MIPEEHALLIVEYLERQEVLGVVFPRDAGAAQDRYQPNVVEALYGWGGTLGASTQIRFRVKEPTDRDDVNRTQGGIQICSQPSEEWGPGWEDVSIRRDGTTGDTSQELHEPDRFHLKISITDDVQDDGTYIRSVKVENLRQAGGSLYSIRIQETGIEQFVEIRSRGSFDDRCTRGRGLIGAIDGRNVEFTPFALLPEPRRRALAGPSLDDAVDTGLLNSSSAALLRANGVNPLRQFQADSFEAIRQLRAVAATQQEAILLTAGTGGGKTEAFAIPLLETLEADIPYPGIRGIFVYPMTALASDQATRFFRYLAALNENRTHPITIGVLYGDTPFKHDDLIASERSGVGLASPFSQCPDCGGEVRFALNVGGQPLAHPQCMDCGRSYPWLRLNRGDVGNRWPHILITTPDMLHRVLSDNFAWMKHCWLGRPVRWCQACGTYKPTSTASIDGQTCVCGGPWSEPISVAPDQLVFDECHMYKGLFGSQVAVLISRINTMCRRYGHSPLLIGASATIAVPEVFGRQLFGCDIRVVRGAQEETDEEPQRYHLFLMPGKVSVLNAIGHILAGCFNADRLTNEINRVLVFSDSKRTVYQLESSLNEFYATLYDTVLVREDGPPATRSHTGDHTREERRAVELAFDRRDLRVLLATQTLEVGVDFEALPLELQVGATYSYNDYMQRVGRAGRRNTQALVICVLRPQVPLDGYYFEHCRELVRFSPETMDDVPLRSDNPFVAERHSPAAVQDYLIGNPPNARLVWRTEEAIQALTNEREDTVAAVAEVFVKAHSEDVDLLTAAIDTGVNRCIAALGDPALEGKTLERLRRTIEMTIRAQDSPVELDLRDFEAYAGVSIAGDLDDLDVSESLPDDPEDPNE